MNYRAAGEGASEMEPKEKEITEEERQAREMKLKNARKYFEVVKLSWVREVNAALGECANVRNTHEAVVSQLLSKMDREQME
jgi:formiminotetrahydrofolate cyclodeaminase